VPDTDCQGDFIVQYLLLIFSNPQVFMKMTPAEQQQGMAAYQAFTEALKQRGAYLGSNRLRMASDATTVRIEDGKSRVLDGPFVDSKEELGGYYLIDVADLDAAISWAARCPGASYGAVEVRPVWRGTA